MKCHLPQFPSGKMCLRRGKSLGLSLLYVGAAQDLILLSFLPHLVLRHRFVRCWWDQSMGSTLSSLELSSFVWSWCELLLGNSRAEGRRGETTSSSNIMQCNISFAGSRRWTLGAVSTLGSCHLVKREEKKNPEIKFTSGTFSRWSMDALLEMNCLCKSFYILFKKQQKTGITWKKPETLCRELGDYAEDQAPNHLDQQRCSSWV